MYSRMIVYCISSALRLQIAQKLMTLRSRVIVDSMPGLQPRPKGTGWPAHLNIGSVNTAVDFGEYRLVLKSNLVLTISKGHRLELPSLETGSSEGFCWELLPVSDRKGEGSDTGLGERGFMSISTLLIACRLCCRRMLASSKTGSGSQGMASECSEESSSALRVLCC